MQQLHGESVRLERHKLAGDHGSHNQHNEEDEQSEVENGVTNSAASAKLRLLERVDRRTDLATVCISLARQSNIFKMEANIPRTKPEEHDRVELVNVRNQERRKHEEQKQVTQAEVGREVSQLGDFAEEFTSRL